MVLYQEFVVKTIKLTTCKIIQQSKFYQIYQKKHQTANRRKRVMIHVF